MPWKLSDTVCYTAEAIPAHEQDRRLMLSAFKNKKAAKSNKSRESMLLGYSQSRRAFGSDITNQGGKEGCKDAAVNGKQQQQKVTC